MSIITTIVELSSLGGRIGDAEKPAYDLLCQKLEEATIPYSTQTFKSATPIYKKAELLVDGKLVECLPSGLKSGEITDNYSLISSLTRSTPFIDTPNINFNPKSDVIGTPNFYHAPSFAVSRKDLPKIMQAKKIKGTLKVEKKNYTARNILTGNTKNPKYVLFAHYDAYFSGATDNAAGVAIVLDVLLANPNKYKNTLFVFAGNEELSYDYPVYWGRCFREFMKDNPRLLENATQIYAVDSAGDGPPLIESNPNLVRLAFPVGVDSIIKKSAVITGDFDKLMGVYHSPADEPHRLSTKYLNDTVELIKTLIT